MASRLSLEDKLSAIRRMRDEPAAPEHVANLQRCLRDRSNLVVAAAAAVVGERSILELAPDVEAAFDRFLVHPTKDDKLCRAKIAVIQALDKLEHDRCDVFRRAARHVQFEPVWGGQEDSAAPLRAAAVIALARIGGPDDMALLVDTLTDPEKEVRIAAAQALSCFQSETAALLLRLKVRCGDAEPEVLSECFAGLLSFDSQANLPFVSGFVDPANSERCEAAVDALGKSRLPDALGVLAACSKQALNAGLKEQILLAIAMLRLPAAIDLLLEIVGSDSEKDAIAALFALKIHNYDPRLRDRIAEVVRKTGSHALQARFERDFRANE
jgi:HEAT repeat protein